MINVWNLCHLVLGCSEEVAVYHRYTCKSRLVPSCTLSIKILKCNSRHSEANHLKLSLVKFTLAGLAKRYQNALLLGMSADYVGCLFGN